MAGRDGSGGDGDDLATAVARETFPTPRVEDGECAGAHRGKPDSLHSYTKLFQTPCVADAEGGPTSNGYIPTPRAQEPGWTNDGYGKCLNRWIREQLPTPTAQDAKNNGAASQHERNTKPLNAEVGGALNPDWVCWLQGWPPGWDSVEPMTANPATWTGSPEQWAEEPADVPRVATGIPDRVARLRMLGNGWVPQCAMLVAGRIAQGRLFEPGETAPAPVQGTLEVDA